MLNVHVGFNNRILANLFRLVEGVELLKFCWHNLNYPCSFRALLIHSLVLIPVPTHCFCGCVIGQTLKIYNEKQSYMASMVMAKISLTKSSHSPLLRMSEYYCLIHSNNN